MKFDKRSWIIAALVAGLSFGMVACGDDDDKDDNDKDDKGQQEELCGNGKIDADEVCDTGANKQGGDDDDVMANDASCQMYGESSSTDKGKTWVDGGKPKCANDCKGFKKGTCMTTQEQEALNSEGVNGIATCGSTLAIADNKATATVTYALGTTTQDSGVKAGIVCGNADLAVASAVAGTTLIDAASGKATLSADLTAGSGICFVVVQAKDKPAVVCPLENGVPAKASGSATELKNSTVTYTIAADADVIASWNDFSLNDMNTKIVGDGIKAQAGSDVDASLKLVIIDDSNVEKLNIKVGQSADSSNKALQVGPKSGKDPVFPTAKTLDAATASHILISSTNLAGKSIKVIAKTGKYGGTFSVVAGSEEIIKEFSSEEYKDVTGTIPAGTTSIAIYPWFTSCNASTCGNINIDSIVIK